MHAVTKVLLVDDDPDILRATSQLLEAAGFDVMSAATGADGLRLANEYRPDIALVDVVLQDTDGVEVCHRIKSDPNLRDIHVLLISSWSKKSGTQVQGLRAGANDYISRPIPNEELIARLRAAERLRRTEQSLRTAEQRLRFVLNTSPIVLFTCEATGTFDATYVSETMRELTGWEPSEVIETPGFWDGHVHPSDKQGLSAAKDQLFERDHHSHDLRFQCKDGGYLWVHQQLNLVRDDRGRPIKIVGSFVDISELKEAERTLRLSEERLRAILNTATDAIINIDRHGIITDVNPATAQMFGYTVKELIGQNVSVLMPPPYCDEHDTYISRYLRTGEARIIGGGREVVGRRKDGSTIPVELAVSEVRHLGIFTGIVRDISDRKEAEEMRTSLGRILEESLNEIYIFDAESLKFIDVNRGARQNLGYTMEQLSALRPLDLNPEYTRETFASLIAPLRSGERKVIQFETVHRRKDRSEYNVEAHLQLTTYREVPAVVATILDITKRIEAQEALRCEHELSENIISTAPVIVLVLDNDGRIIRFNPFVEQLTGWRLDEVQGRDWLDTFLYEGDQIPMRRMFDNAIRGKRIRGRIAMILTKAGREREVEWYDAPLTNAEDQQVGLLFTGRDITDRRILERELLDIAAEEQRRIGNDLHDSVCQELTGLGMLAHGVAEMLADEGAAQSLENAGLLHLRDVTRRLSAGIGQATAHARTLSHGLIPVDVDAQGLMAALRELASSIESLDDISCTFEHDRSIELPDNFVSTHLYRIAQEAISNALKHSRAKHIRVSLKESDDQVILSVSDDGVGIADASERNGMGLRIMKYRADLIGAVVSVEEGACGGTTVRCQFAKKRQSFT